MTLCLALVCHEGDGPRIVICADSRLDEISSSTDKATKFDSLGRNWFSLLSGDDWIMAVELSRFIGLRIEKADSLDRREKVFTTVKQATSDFQSSPFCEASHRVDLIVGGFSERLAMLMYTGYDGTGPYTSLCTDMAVIGSGAQIASAILRLRKYGPRAPEKKILYLAYEAKRYSENAPSVGPKTALAVIRPNGRAKTFPNSYYSGLEECRKRFGIQPIDLTALPDPRSPKDAE